MTTFPTITPSSRTFTPGQYPHTPFQALSGKQSRVRHSSVMIGSQVQLRYSVLDESEMIQILDHYNTVKGGLISFLLPTIAWSGNENVNDFTLPGNAWRYAQPPEVEEVFCAGGIAGGSGAGYVVQVQLESVPGEGAGLLGIDLIIRASLTTGRAAASNGAQLTIAIGVDVAVGIAAGIAETIAASLSTVGAATGGTGVLVGGEFFAIGALLNNGLAAAGLSRLFTVTSSLAAGMGFSSSDPDFAQVEFLLHGWDGYFDASSKRRTITKGSAVTTTTNARFGGQAIEFSEVEDSWMEISEVTLSGDFTIETWIYLNSQPPPSSGAGSGRHTVVQGTNAGLNNTIELYTFSDQIYVKCEYNAGGGTSIGGNAGGYVTVGKWHHIRLVVNASNVRLFIDGTIRETKSSATNRSFKFDKIGFTSRPGSLNYRFDGAIQGLRASNVARSTANFSLPTQSWPDTTNRLQGGTYGVAQTVTVSRTGGAATGAADASGITQTIDATLAEGAASTS